MMRLSRRLRSRPGPALMVRRAPSWPVRAVVVLMALTAGVALGSWWAERSAAGALAGATAGSLADGSRHLSAADLARLQAASELQRLQGIANAADSQLKVERSAGERLARQVRELELDNARLKSDLAYLESMLPATDGQPGMAVRGFRVEHDAAQSQLNFRALLTQGGRLERDFVGSMQLQVQLQVAGRPLTLIVPEQGAPAVLREKFKLSFRRAHRVQAVIPLPAGSAVRAVQLRLLEGGVVRAQQTAMP